MLCRAIRLVVGLGLALALALVVLPGVGDVGGGELVIVEWGPTLDPNGG